MTTSTVRNILIPQFFRQLSAALILMAAMLAQSSHAQEAAEASSTPDASYGVLADLLENDQTRKKLIEQLRALAAPVANKSASTAATDQTGQERSAEANRALPPSATPEDAPISQKVALSLERFTSGLAHDMSDTADVFMALIKGEPAIDGVTRQWATPLKTLLIALLTVLASYFVFRMLAGIGFARLNAWIKKDSPPSVGPQAHGPALPVRHGPWRSKFATQTLSRKLLGVAAALVVDVAATLLAATAGYIATLTVAGQNPGASLFALQFLSAFVMIEVAKAVSRGIFATRYEQLRLLPLSPEAANYWNHWLTLLIGVIGYTLLVIVPLVGAVFRPSVGQLLGLVIMLAVYFYGVRVIWKNRKAVKASLVGLADKSSVALFGTLIRVLSRTWHLIAIAYFTVLLVVSQTAQQQALAFMARATAQTAAAVLIGMMLASGLSSLLSHRIMLPGKWRQSFPTLESRINTYVPVVLKGLRLLILIVVTLVVLDAWHAFNLVDWLQSDHGQAAIAMVLHLGIILLIATLSWTVIASIIEHRLDASSSNPSEREKTLLMLFRNATAIVIATMTILVVLSQIGINIGPLIAGAGVAGLAIGFGAQKLVQDVITGVFIQLENGMNRNDTVEVGSLFGTVEKITIRSVGIRTLDGGYHMVPFSSIDQLTNHTRDYGYHYGEYNIAHRENVDDAIAQMELAFKDLMQDPVLAQEVMEEISIPGVTALNQNGFTIRVLIKTTPGNQWMIQRGFNKLLKRRFDEAGIELPYPHTVLHFGHDKSGDAQPVDVRFVDTLKEVTEAADGKAPASSDQAADAPALAGPARGPAAGKENA
ncbi:mechanosensitive ion channel domain-containing protein [Pollutimonas subterranea]|uniref:mechanosensitive ion channel domain-containing protein n=1 Tax=Pollutimonas subterranea TaxID=2045210 RepID=UPI001E39F19C|nr:mechanosensitive ion channel domain-containing protein [Pollutimonas subterranea]